ncbi:MAG TPA: glycosyltransferase [Polyangiaceae bacterium]|nr:glycosyltransferase [Polyangiaceae bacterium]
MPHRVLWFTTGLGGGGAESHLIRVANALDRNEFTNEIAVARGGGVLESRLRDVPLRAFAGPTSRSSSLSLLRAVTPLRRLLRDVQPDLICSVMGPANVVALAAVAGMKSPPAVVLCAQNNPQLAFAGWHPLNVAVRYGMRHHYRRADAIVALSNGVAQALPQLDAGLTGLIHVIPNAALDDSVQELRHAPCPVARPQGQLLVACGRLNEQKGYPVLLDAVQRLNRERPVTLWIVGEGPLRRMLEQRVAQLGIAHRVQFLGFHPNPYPLMAAADVFVLSSHYEGFGNVIVEAMACGAPVVSTNCPHGPGDVIRSGENGVLVPPNDAAALARGVQLVLDDAALRQRLIAHGSVTAERYRDTRIAAEYGALFARVLAAKPKTREAA